MCGTDSKHKYCNYTPEMSLQAEAIRESQERQRSYEERPFEYRQKER